MDTRPKTFASKMTALKYKRAYTNALKSINKRSSTVNTARTKLLRRSNRNRDEIKFFDTALSFNFDSTGEVPATGQLALIPQGDSGSTRDGRQANIKSIQIRGLASFAPGAGAAGACNAYLWLILDTQANGAPAAFTDVFTSTDPYRCMINLDNSARFRILKKWVIPFESPAGVTTAYMPLEKHIEFYEKVDIPINWSSTTGAIGEIKSNNIFLMAGGTLDDLASFLGTCRLRFTG